jgi:disulfide bond formation protein DsbB
MVAATGVEVANKVFLALTLAANAFVVGLAIVALSGATHRRRAVEVIGPEALRFALLVATVTTLGSLYYSEVANFTPCLLCWYQRICMYPLVAILGVGVLRGNRDTRWFAAPFVLVGAPLALYHWLVERVPAFADSVACSASVPCAVPWFEELGFVTLAYMDLSAFLLIGVLLGLDLAFVRATPEEIE